MSMLRPLLASLVLFTVVPSCATKYVAPGREPALGSDANIVVSKTKSGNYFVELALTSLPPPERLDPAATAYVAWFQPAEQAAVKAGAVAYDVNDRDGFLEATTPHRIFTLLVTLEATPDVGVPSKKVIVSQAVKAKK